MNLPTKDEIKKQYGIPEDGFEILTSMPPEEQVAKKGGFLTRVADCLGIKTWMWKSFSGFLFAVVFVIPKISSTVEFWSPTVQKSYLVMTDYWQSFSIEPPDTPIHFVAFVPPDQEQIIGTGPMPIDQYPLGTGVFPLSSGWVGPTRQWIG
jgi:hypothetical protein